MRKAVRRLRQLRLPAMAARRGLPLALAAFAVVGAASTAASAGRESTVDSAPAGATILPPAVPPTYAYPGSTASLPGVPSVPGAPRNNGSAAGPAGGTPSGDAAPGLAANGIPARAVQAYQAAAASMTSCGIPWSLLAAIGRVESNHGRFAGATLLADGRSDPPIVGIPLDGRPGVAQIGDTDSGRYDGDTTHDRAVGPMQFIPGTWALFATDGDHDRKSDPFDIDDAAAAAAKYLCRAGGDLSTAAGQQDAVYSYNRSDSYVALVLALSAEYSGGAPVDTAPAPDGTPRPLPPITTPTLPPGSVGPPPAATPPPSASRKPKPKPTASPTTGHPSPSTTAPSPSSPAPSATTSQTPSPSPSDPTPTPTPSPTCTPAPTPTATPTATPTPTPSGSANGNAASTASSPSASAATASPAGTTSASAAATGTPTPSPSPSLPTCPTP